MGTKVLVYAENETGLPHAEALARELGEELWAMRKKAGIPYLTMDESLDRAYAAPKGPVVISDGPDNPGGGAPCDATFFITRLLERGETDWAVGYLYDPHAVRIAIEAGDGAQLKLRVGGKTCELSGNPMDIFARVIGIEQEATVTFIGVDIPVGDAVAVDLGDNRHIVMISARNQTLDHALFDRLGVNLSSKRAVVVKSSQHFYASFSEIASEILYASPPGVVTPDLKSLPYEYADTTIWPLADYPKSAKSESIEEKMK